MIQLRNSICAVLLALLVLSEAVLAFTTAFDYTNVLHGQPAFTALLFALPCALIMGSVLLLATSRKEHGFYLCASSLILYAGFVCVNALQAARADWTALTTPILFCALGIVAARVLMIEPDPVMGREAQSPIIKRVLG